MTKTGTSRPRSKVTLADIATAAGVTRMTVSNALNDRGGVSEEMRDRIRRIAGEMGYVTNWMAKKLSETRHGAETGIIGVLAEIHTPFMAEVSGAISSAVRDSGRDMLVYSLPEPGKQVPGNVLNLLLQAVDGVIAVIPRDTRDLPTLAHAHVPVVTIDPLRDDTSFPSVASDSYQGARLAMQHLIGLGHRRIAFLSGEEGRFSASERLRAYHDCMREAGLPVQPDDTANAGFLQEPGRIAAARILARRDRPTAIFAANDLSAIGAMTAAHAAGLSVPDDISIIGFDDIAAAGQMQPGLTTVRQDYSAIGTSALELLLWTREHPPEAGKAPHRTLLPTELVLRGTTRTAGRTG